MMSGTVELFLLLAIRRRRRRCLRQKRRFWVHPLLSERLEKGLFATLYRDLEQDDDKFFSYFRMSRKSFYELKSILNNEISGINTNMRRCISVEEKLAITLRYLGTGCSMIDLHFQYRIGVSTISEIIREVCSAIWRVMKSICMPTLSKEDWLKVADLFERRTNFPNCLGAIDGKHIRLIKPTDSGSLYYNYKHFFSLILLAVCDSNYKFLYVDIGAYGKSADSTIFKNSVLFKKLNNNEMNIPENRPLKGSNITCPFVLIGDEGFGITKLLMRPFGGNFLTVKKRVFNYRLSRARRYIECSFGILANKWRIFYRPLNVSLDLAEQIVQACCVLHNFIRERDGYNFENTLTVQGLVDMVPDATRGGKTVNDIRDQFANYFLSNEGQIPWQLQRI